MARTRRVCKPVLQHSVIPRRFSGAGALSDRTARGRCWCFRALGERPARPLGSHGASGAVTAAAAAGAKAVSELVFRVSQSVSVCWEHVRSRCSLPGGQRPFRCARGCRRPRIRQGQSGEKCHRHTTGIGRKAQR